MTPFATTRRGSPRPCVTASTTMLTAWRLDCSCTTLTACVAFLVDMAAVSESVDMRVERVDYQESPGRSLFEGRYNAYVFAGQLSGRSDHGYSIVTDIGTGKGKSNTCKSPESVCSADSTVSSTRTQRVMNFATIIPMATHCSS